MAIGTSIVIGAIGAILAFGIDADRAEGFDLGTIGVILMVAGAVGLVASLIVAGRRDMTVDHAPPHGGHPV